MKNYYQILGVNAASSKDEIKEAYLKLSKKVHPDLNSGDNFFTELFKSINEAYQVLMDEERRANYNIQFNSYLYDFNYIKEKENELNKREADLFHISQKKKLFFRSFFSLFAGMSVVAIFSFALDSKPYEEETFVDRNERTRKEEIVLPKRMVEIRKPINAPIAITTTPPMESFNNVKLVKPIPQVALPSLANNVKKERVIAKEKADLKLVTLSDNNLLKIVLEIVNEKNKRNNNATCVRILKSADSNVDNAFHLAQKLRSNGFVLAGRETTSEKINGLQVDYSKNMITVTVGSI